MTIWRLESGILMPNNILAAIDLGSNSFHLVVARRLDGRLQILDRIKQRVRLAEGMDDDRNISEEAMQRGLDCLTLFAERLQAQKYVSASRAKKGGSSVELRPESAEMGGSSFIARPPLFLLRPTSPLASRT